MATNQPTLFGAYPWALGAGISPVLFATGYVPQTYSVALADAVTDTDVADVMSILKALSESITLTDAQVKTLAKVLSDSTTASETFAKTLAKVLAETASVTDSQTIIFTIKHLSDFLILKEWISLRLLKQINWVNPAGNENIFDTLWGKYKFGSSLFGGVKPTSTWTKGIKRQQAWTNSNGHKYNA